MFKRLCITAFAAVLLLGIALPAAASGGPFAIAYGYLVAQDLPAAGAGYIDNVDTTDTYEFSATAGDVMILDVVSGANTNFLWRLEVSDGTLVFDGLYIDRKLTLTHTDTYRLIVRGMTASSVGDYSFWLLLAPPPQHFDIAVGDTVSNGIPAAGAGMLESAGALDVFTFDADAGDVVILDVLSGANTNFLWRLDGPGPFNIFDGLYVDLQKTLPQAGTYTLTVYGSGVSSTGAYSFRILEVTASQHFNIAIGDTVLLDSPAPGAGHIEAAGALDVYSFDVTAGQTLIFEVLSGNPGDFLWQLDAPDSTTVFHSLYLDRQETLLQTGAYTLTVSGGSLTATGAYSFRLVEVAAPQHFVIAVGDTVSDGVPAPGAGSIETHGAVDVYTFDGVAGQIVRFTHLAGDGLAVYWTLTAPDTTVLFDTYIQHRQELTLDAGAYTLTLRGTNLDDTGPYSFELVEVVLPDLIENGGFEIDDDGDKVPDGWTAKNLSGDKRKCAGNGHNSDCALIFKGKPNEAATYKQTVADTTGIAVDDILMLSANLWSGKPDAGVIVVVSVKYVTTVNGKRVHKLKLKLSGPPPGDYGYYSTSLQAGDDIESITVKLKYRKTFGKVKVDNVELLHAGAAPARTAGPLPPPPAPPGFRR